jgi:hypothetical protein
MLKKLLNKKQREQVKTNIVVEPIEEVESVEEVKPKPKRASKKIIL